MASSRFAWGIDIGNRALKAIKLVRDGDSVRVDDFDVIEHETVLSNAGDNREAIMLQALKTFVDKHPMKGGAVSVGVSGQASFARFIKLPPVDEKKIPEIVKFEAVQQIPFPLDDVEWSYQLFRAPESPDVEVGIFAMRKELINQHIKYFTDHDLNVQAVQMNPLAVYNAMQFDNRIEGTTMIIDLGAENTDLIIADADTVWLRSIPIGGNNFTETLVKSFKLNFAKAEDLKRNAATSKYARQIFQAMRPVFADLVAEVQRSIGFYASVHRDSRIKRIVTVGGTFKLPGLQKYLQQNLQLEVERLDTFGAGAPPDPKQAANFQDNVLSLVGAYGLALQAMGEGKITSSLLPARIRRERLWQDKTKFFAAAAALFVLGTGIGYTSVFFSNMSYESSSGVRGDISRIQSQATNLDSEWTKIQGSGAADRQRIVNIRSLTQYRDLYTQILADLHAAAPSMTGTPDEIKKTPRGDRKQMFIENLGNRYMPDMGLVTDLAAYASMPASVGAAAAPVGFGGGFGAPPGINAPPDVAPPAPVEGAAPSAAAGQHGFVITLTGTTPNKNLGFIDQTFLKNLQTTLAKEKLPPGKQYYLDKVQVITRQKVRDDAARLAALQAAYTSAMTAKTTGQFNAPAGGGYVPGVGGGFGGPPDVGGRSDGIGGIGGGGFGQAFGQPPGAAPGVDPAAIEAAAKAPFMDRLFPDEDVRDDLQFVIVMTFVLDPPPAAPVAGAAPAASAQ